MFRAPFKSYYLAAILSVGFSGYAHAQANETDQVRAALNNYMIGSSYNNPAQIKSAFYPEAEMFLDHSKQPIFIMKPEKYAAGFANQEQDVFNGRYGKILDIDIEGNIASAKAEILVPAQKSRYIDMFLLKKLDGNWKIISKSAGRADSTRNGEKMLLIASNKGMGQNFTDIIVKYEAAKAKGYTLDIVSPDGGAVEFYSLHMNNPVHKKYVYDADFMFTLEHTLSPDEVKTSDYQSAAYLCNLDAKKSLSGHKGVDNLYTEICKSGSQCSE